MTSCSPRSRATVLAVLLAAVVAACGSSDGAAGQRLPDVDVTPLAGGAPVSLAAIDGPAVINLWATWCVPCRTEIPDFEAVHQNRGGAVRFVGVNIGEDAAEAASFLDQVGATYDQFLDPQGFAQTELAAPQLPTTIVIDESGAVTTRHIGRLDQDGLDAAIDSALGG